MLCQTRNFIHAWEITSSASLALLPKPCSHAAVNRHALQLLPVPKVGSLEYHVCKTEQNFSLHDFSNPISFLVTRELRRDFCPRTPQDRKPHPRTPQDRKPQDGASQRSVAVVEQRLFIRPDNAERYSHQVV
jgi:hypothetical protein